jgi:hypothetical protein
VRSHDQYGAGGSVDPQGGDGPAALSNAECQWHAPRE